MHMAFLSRVFKNLQWYGMTKVTRNSCKRLFLVTFFVSAKINYYGKKSSIAYLLLIQFLAWI